MCHTAAPQSLVAGCTKHSPIPDLSNLPRGSFHRVFQGNPASFTRPVAQSFNLNGRCGFVNPCFYNFRRTRSAANSLKILSLSQIVKG